MITIDLRVRDMSDNYPNEQKTLLTSWDDGLHSDLKLASLLEGCGFKGTYFATTGPSGARKISDRDLEKITEMGHEIGNHGWTHRSMTTLTTAEIVEDVRIGKEQVERFMKAAPVVAPPRGRINQHVIEVLDAEGYLIRTAGILGRARPRLPLVDPTVQLFPHSRTQTALHQLKHRTWPGWNVIRGWYGSGELLTRLEHIVQRPNAPSVLHIWGHSGELETLGLWGLLERVLDSARKAGYVGSTVGDFYAPESG
jgi:peptidoglycan/xylan/chitin deacetylase (PgdA/CDA1 family)